MTDNNEPPKTPDSIPADNAVNTEVVTPVAEPAATPAPEPVAVDKVESKPEEKKPTRTGPRLSILFALLATGGFVMAFTPHEDNFVSNYENLELECKQLNGNGVADDNRTAMAVTVSHGIRNIPNYTSKVIVFNNSTTKKAGAPLKTFNGPYNKDAAKAVAKTWCETGKEPSELWAATGPKP